MAEIFETADILVSLGGDHGNTVPILRATAGQIAVLQTLHGKDAVNEIKPNGSVTYKSMRVEKARLAAIYGNAKDSEGNSILEKLYPGVAARIYQKLSELELDPDQFARGHLPKNFVDNRTDVDADIEAGIDAANGYEPEAETDAVIDAVIDEHVSAVIDDGEGEETVTAADEAELQAKLTAPRAARRAPRVSDVLA